MSAMRMWQEWGWVLPVLRVCLHAQMKTSVTHDINVNARSTFWLSLQDHPLKSCHMYVRCCGEPTRSSSTTVRPDRLK